MASFFDNNLNSHYHKDLPEKVTFLKIKGGGTFSSKIFGLQLWSMGLLVAVLALVFVA